jgi:hypothetical protein
MARSRHRRRNACRCRTGCRKRDCRPIAASIDNQRLRRCTRRPRSCTFPRASIGIGRDGRCRSNDGLCHNDVPLCGRRLALAPARPPASPCRRRARPTTGFVGRGAAADLASVGRTDVGPSPSSHAHRIGDRKPDFYRHRQVPSARQLQLNGQHCAAGPGHRPLASSHVQRPWSQRA